MKILVNGPSVSIGKGSWPYKMKEKLGCDVVNFSRINAGNKYIHDSTMLELSQRKYDLVIISWTYFIRMDVRSRWPSAITHASELEDPCITNNPYLDKFWFFVRSTHPNTILSQDEINHYNYHLKTYNELQNCYNKSYSDEYRLEETLLQIISLQSVLKNLNIPYLFTFYKPLLHLKKFQHLYDLIDYENVHKVHLCHLARQNGWMFYDHPDSPAHTAYLDTLLEHPNIKNLIKS